MIYTTVVNLIPGFSPLYSVDELEKESRARREKMEDVSFSTKVERISEYLNSLRLFRKV